MKKAIYLIIFSALILGGCSEKQGTVAVASAVDEQEIPDYYEDYVLNPQVTDDRTLQNLGQSKRDAKGEAVVKAVNMNSKAYEIGPVQLTVKESKILQLKPDYSLIDFYHSYTHEQEFTLVKMFVEISNLSDEDVNFAPVALLETDKEELKLWEDDIYLEELTGTLIAGETKRGNVGFIIEESKVDSIEVTTSDVFSSHGEQLEKAKNFTTQFD